MKWISTSAALAAICFGLAAGRAVAQEGSVAQSFDALAARMQQQDDQIRQLQSQVNAMQQQQQQGVPVIPAALGSGTAAAAPAPASAPKPVEVGSDTGDIKTTFKNGTGLNFTTPSGDFTMHAGFWVQWDNVWWRQNAVMNAPASATTGAIGPLEDGDFWRRIRPFVEGTFYETCEYRFNIALENNQFSTAGLDEFWIGINKIPVIGTIRAGHVKDCEGLEGDMASSSRCMTFMERSLYSQCIENDENFVNGVWFGNTWCDDRVFGSCVVFRPDNGSSGDFLGTGQYGVQTRWTCLPIYEDEGRHLLHLGLSAGWRDGANSLGSGTAALDTVRLRARPELRDDDPAASPGSTTNANGVGGAGQFLPDANANRIVDTGAINCQTEYRLGTEFLYIRGPWSLQAEYGWNFLNNANLTGRPVENYQFNGGYVQLSYILTGEYRRYDKKYGTLSRYYLGGDGPYENAFLVRDADGNFCCGHGAWELAFRYSYVDLNSDLGSAGPIKGGIANGVSVALNWYLNTNLSVMTDWVYDYRYDANSTANPTVAIPNGSTNGFGTEVQLTF